MANGRPALAGSGGNHPKQAVGNSNGTGTPKRKERKRRREDISSVENESSVNGSLAESTPSRSKKAKTKHAEKKAAVDLTSDAEPTNLSSLKIAEDVELPSEFDSLRTNYDVTDIHIISSTKIEAKVTRILELLKTFSFVKPHPKPNIVYLHAKAANASKLISILEIAKRNIAEEFKWFQYNQLGEIKEEKKREVGGQVLGGDDTMMVDDEGTADSTDFRFETMKTPFERAIEGKPKIRAVPFLGIYLSRVRVQSLKELYGEQTNAKN